MQEIASTDATERFFYISGSSGFYVCLRAHAFAFQERV